VAGIKRICTASAIAALPFSGFALAQQAPAADAPKGEEQETVIVTGIRQSLAKGLEVKRESTQVVESIIAEDIGKLPDNNVIEALQRVTGVQITNRGGGEAGGGDPNVPGISIRGLPDITTTWNGRNVFTGVGRALALQDIPANLINRVDVFKTRSSDQIETGLAGQIDVRTRRPFDFPGMQMSFSARAVDQEQRDSVDPNLSFLASNTWDLGSGRFGALFNVSYSRTRYRDQSATAGALVPFVTATGPLPPGFTPLQRVFNGSPPIWEAGSDSGLPTAPGSTLDFDTGPGVANFPYLLSRDALFASDFEGDRKRPAANLSLQFAPNETSEYTFEAFYQGYREQMFNNLHFTFADWWGSLRQPPEGTITTYPGTNLIKTRVVGNPFNFNSGDATWQDTDTYVYALNGKWDIGDKFTLQADVQFQESQFQTTFLAVRTTRVPQEITIDLNAHDGVPSWHFTNGAGGNVDDCDRCTGAQWCAHLGVYCADAHGAGGNFRGRIGRGACVRERRDPSFIVIRVQGFAIAAASRGARRNRAGRDVAGAAARRRARRRGGGFGVHLHHADRGVTTYVRRDLPGIEIDCSVTVGGEHFEAAFEQGNGGGCVLGRDVELRALDDSDQVRRFDAQLAAFTLANFVERVAARLNDAIDRRAALFERGKFELSVGADIDGGCALREIDGAIAAGANRRRQLEHGAGVHRAVRATHRDVHFALQARNHDVTRIQSERGRRDAAGSNGE